MKKLLASTIAGALIIFIACWAFGDVRPPHFYKVTVTLTDGTSITGASYGLLGFFGSGLSYEPVKSVALAHTPSSTKGHITFFDNPKTVTYERSDDFIPGLKLSVYTDYETIKDHPAIGEFYWVKQEELVPFMDILRLDTLKIIGKGFVIYQDPALYANVKEPYLMVEDCGLGCPAKLFSKDRSVTKEQLQELWDQYLDCKYRLNTESSQRVAEVMKKYRLKIIVDPFCID